MLDHIRQGIEHSNIQAETQGSQDLKQMLNSIYAADVPKVKGSRFTHTEKLQFTKVSQSYLIIFPFHSLLSLKTGISWKPILSCTSSL